MSFARLPAATCTAIRRVTSSPETGPRQRLIGGGGGGGGSGSASPEDDRYGEPGGGCCVLAPSLVVVGPARRAAPLIDNKTGQFTVDADKNVGKCSALWKDPFHTLIGFSMPSLLLLFVASYAVLFATFTLLFFYIEHRVDSEEFGDILIEQKWTMWQCFLCAWQTITTVGYGVVYPRGALANAASCTACVLSLIVDCLGTGIFFAKMANASNKASSILHSSVAVITPAGTHCQLGVEAGEEELAKGKVAESSFECRIHHASDEVLVDPSVRLFMSSWKSGQGGSNTVAIRFQELKLSNQSSRPFLQYAWSTMHTIDAESPLSGYSTAAALARDNVEIIVVVLATASATGCQCEHRCSYTADSILFDRRFVDVMSMRADGGLDVNLSMLSDTEPASPDPRGTAE